LDPVHEEVSYQGKDHHYWLQRDEETDEEKNVGDVDVMVTQLELDTLVDAVVLLLCLG
jgi:hypothetical protein